MLISIINQYRIQNKVLQGNEVSFIAEVDSLFELSFIATQENIVLSTFTDNIKDGDHFIQSQCIAFDYDEAEATKEELEECLTGYNFSIITTQSHMKWKKESAPCERFRLLVPLDNPAKNIASYQATYDVISKIIIPPNDTCTRSPIQYIAKHRDVIAFNEDHKNFTTIHTNKKETKSQEIGAIGDYKEFMMECIRTSKIYAECSKMLSTNGSKHNGSVKLAFHLKKNGIDEQSAYNEAYNLLLDKEKVDLNHLRKTIKSVYGVKHV